MHYYAQDICATIYPTNNKIMYWNVRKNGMEYKKKYLVEYKKIPDGL